MPSKPDWTEALFLAFAVAAMGLFAWWVLVQLLPAWWLMFVMMNR